jgi:hypothetical protein
MHNLTDLEPDQILVLMYVIHALCKKKAKPIIDA